MLNRWKVRLNHVGILILWLVFIDGYECAYWNDRSYRNLTRIRRQATTCKNDEFPCNNGLCIKDELECDGKEDCKDGSDETSACNGLLCPADFGFKCAYGACIPKKGKCNGIKECRDNSDESECPNKPVKPTTTTTCVLTQFMCLSGECINDEKLCDGRADCADHSDETAQECSGLSCPNAFSCKYGACVAKNAKCNGIKECFDGSDEEGCPNTITPVPPPVVTPTPPLVKPTPQPPPSGSCVVPPVPANGAFVNSNNPAGTFKQGDFVPNFNALITKCNRNYKTTPPNKSYPICISGTWTGPPLECARYCSSAISTKTTKITCKFDRIPLESCKDPVDRTIVNIQCEYLYEDQGGNPTRYCRDGTWDYPITECRPVCGQKRAAGKPNIIGGKNAVQGDYPWHVGIYANDLQKTHLCGGSILNQRVIVSAAHCFADNDGNLYPKENYLIAAGKYYRPYDDKRDENTAQYSTIKRIHKPDRYKGPIGNYEADIILVILTEALVISLTVQPVCVDWNNEFEYQQLVENNLGVVVGWGFTVQGNAPSEELKELAIPYIPYDQCYDQVPKDFRRFLTYDKVCAGFLLKNIAVCQGDSGGGLTFPQKQGREDRYYIRGIVSTSPLSDSSCDPDQYATYTMISSHIEFVKEIETVNRI